MVDTNKSLAELAETLSLCVSDVDQKLTVAEALCAIDKAQRIVAELAKIEDNMLNASCTVAMLMRCRAIAEEGCSK